MTSRSAVTWCLVFAVALLLPLNPSASGQDVRPEEVKFPSGNLLLHGFLYRPQGNGSFPAILCNHGSEEKRGAKPALAEFFLLGYVFFVPHRRGQGLSPSDSYVESLRSQGPAEAIAFHEAHLEDQLAALAYLKQLSDVDSQRIALAGCSYGGIQTVLAIEANADQKLGLRAAI